jgi:hypothetical protein
MSDQSDVDIARKAWRLRNSDGLHTWGDEYGRRERLQSPPAFDLEEHTLPTSPHQLTEPDADSGHDARAIRHVHIWDPSLEDPDA